MQEEVDKLKKEMDEKFEKLFDKFDHCMVTVRDSVQPSISSVLMQIIQTQKEQSKEIADLTEHLAPISRKFAMVNGFGGTFLLIAKYAGAGAAIYFAFKYFAEFLRKI